MSKLKFDRLLNFTIKKGESVKVPKGELWRGKMFGLQAGVNAYLNDSNVSSNNSGTTCPEITCVEDASIRCGESQYTKQVILQGVVFKVVENV